MKKVTSQYLLCITSSHPKFQTGIISLVKKNPADLCTRTQTDFKLIQQKLFHGPENILLKTFDLKEINIRNQFEESLEN